MAITKKAPIVSELLNHINSSDSQVEDKAVKAKASSKAKRVPQKDDQEVSPSDLQALVTKLLTVPYSELQKSLALNSGEAGGTSKSGCVLSDFNINKQGVVSYVGPTEDALSSLVRLVGETNQVASDLLSKLEPYMPISWFSDKDEPAQAMAHDNSFNEYSSDLSPTVLDLNRQLNRLEIYNERLRSIVNAVVL